MNSSEEDSFRLPFPALLINWRCKEFRWNSRCMWIGIPPGEFPGAGAVFSKYDSVIPDLVFVLNERWAEIASGEWFTGAPDIVIEVLSPGFENRQRDLSVKRQLYAKHGLQEYWVVDTEHRAVEIFRLTQGSLDSVALLIGDDEITSSILPGFKMKVPTVFNF